MKALTPKQMLTVFREVVEESARRHAPNPKKITKKRTAVKAKRVAKNGRKLRTAAE